MSRGTNVKITLDPHVEGLTECDFTTGSAGWFYYIAGHMGLALLCAAMLCSGFNAFMSRMFALYIIGVLLFVLVLSRNALAFNVCILYISILSILWWYGVGINLRYFLVVFRFVS